MITVDDIGLTGFVIFIVSRKGISKITTRYDTNHRPMHMHAATLVAEFTNDIRMIRHPEVQTDYKLLTISSRGFQANGYIPKKYTCEGYNTNPPIDIKGIPNEAKSLVLFMEDPDAPRKTFVHWVLWNIPIKHHLQEDELTGDQGVNDFGDTGYGGPCPPTGTHRYYFKIYALDELLDLPPYASREVVEHAMQNHIIAYGELMGRYCREVNR